MLGPHRVAGVERVIDADPKPTKLAVSKFKEAEQMTTPLLRKICRVVNGFRRTECSNFFRHARAMFAMWTYSAPIMNLTE